MNGSRDKQQNAMAEGLYVRRVMHLGECAEAHRLLENEDWNLTFAKFKRICEVFPTDLFVTVVKDTQEVVAMVSAIPTFPDQYMVGHLIVKPKYQSQGLGKAMLLHLLNSVRTKSTITVILTAVPETDKFYSKFGFQAIGPTHYVNYVKVDRQAVQRACSNHNTEKVVISKYTSDMFEAVNDYDTSARNYDCGKYLSVMIDVSDTFLLALNKVSGQIVGYIAGVDETSLLLADGLYADSDAIALLLYSTLLDMYPDREVVKIQEIKPRDFLSQFGDLLPKSHTYTRMAMGPMPSDPVLSKLYIVCDCDYAE